MSDVNPLPACYDCGLVYGDRGWCDIVIPTDVWLVISPTKSQGGLLCFNCIARRLEVWGLRNVPLMIGSGPFELTPQDPKLCEVCGGSGTFGTTGRCLNHYETPPEVGLVRE